MQHLQSSAWRIWRSHLVIPQNLNQNNLCVLFIHEVLFLFLQFPQILSESLVETCRSADVASCPMGTEPYRRKWESRRTSSAYLSFVWRIVWKPWSEQTGFITSEQWLHRNTVNLLSPLSPLGAWCFPTALKKKWFTDCHFPCTLLKRTHSKNRKPWWEKKCRVIPNYNHIWAIKLYIS